MLALRPDVVVDVVLSSERQARAHPPAPVDPAQFDYAAEDAALAALPRAGETRP